MALIISEHINNFATQLLVHENILVKEVILDEPGYHSLRDELKDLVKYTDGKDDPEGASYKTIKLATPVGYIKVRAEIREQA